MSDTRRMRSTPMREPRVMYPGDQHYFADSSLPSYDADATALLTRRVLEFLDRI